MRRPACLDAFDFDGAGALLLREDLLQYVELSSMPTRRLILRPNRMGAVLVVKT